MSQPADWAAQFQDLATGAGQMYARMLRRYNELLDRVARGELTPDAVQQQFREYLQEQATTSTRDLVEISVGLLAGLLHLEARYRDALLDGLLPASTPPPPPPAPGSVDLTNWFQALATYAAEQSARSIARHQELVDRVAAGSITPDRVRQEGERFLEQHAPAFLGDVMGLGLTFVGKLQQSSAALSDGLYDHLLGRPAEAPGPLEPPVCVELRGHSGSDATATIVIENTRQTAADVSCRVSDFTRRSGESRVQASMTIEPSHFTLAPGELRDVNLRLRLDQVHFAVNADYVATLLVAGAGERDLVIQLMAHAEAAAPRNDARPRKAASAARPSAVGARAPRRRRQA